MACFLCVFNLIIKSVIYKVNRFLIRSSLKNIRFDHGFINGLPKSGLKRQILISLERLILLSFDKGQMTKHIKKIIKQKICLNRTIFPIFELKNGAIRKKFQFHFFRCLVILSLHVKLITLPYESFSKAEMLTIWTFYLLKPSLQLILTVYHRKF